MPITQLPFTNGFYESDSLPLSAQECLNWYVNIPQAPSLATETLFRTPGILELATSGVINQANRGAWSLDGKPYFVNGSNLYRLESDDTLTTLGTISGSDRVSMADNGTQLFIMVPGGDGYIFTESPDTLTQITDLDFTANGAPQYVVFIDGYFVLTTDSKKFIVSALNDGLSYNALDFGSAEANPDDTVAPIVFKNQLFIAGSITTEAFQNVGGAGFPFRRSGLYLSKGISSPLSVVESNDTFVWIGAGKNEAPAIWSFIGNSVQKISTTPIDNLLQELTEAQLVQVAGWSYAEAGAYFVGFALPSTTIVLDVISNRWHERKSLIQASAGVNELIRYRVQSMVKAYNKIIVADAFDGRIGHVSLDYFNEYGQDIIRRVATQPFQNNMESFTAPALEMTAETGKTDGTIEEPLIGLEISTNGGYTFTPQRYRSLGKIGEYKRRAIWRRNGRFDRLAIFRFTVSDAVKTSLIQLTGDLA